MTRPPAPPAPRPQTSQRQHPPQRPARDREAPPAHGPAPLGTLMVVAVVVLVTLFLWMLVLGVQQGRA